MRARNIKPGFFTNDLLVECSYAARLLFIALWCMADREGRLEDRPKKIKMNAYPADAIDVEPLLQELAEQQGDGPDDRLIVRYEVDGKRLIWIPKFLQHQRPHHQEKQSKLAPYARPEPTKAQTTSHQGANQSALNPESLILNPPPTPPASGGDCFDFSRIWETAHEKMRVCGRDSAERSYRNAVKRPSWPGVDVVVADLAARAAQWRAESEPMVVSLRKYLREGRWDTGQDIEAGKAEAAAQAKAEEAEATAQAKAEQQKQAEALDRAWRELSDVEQEGFLQRAAEENDFSRGLWRDYKAGRPLNISLIMAAKRIFRDTAFTDEAAAALEA